MLSAIMNPFNAGIWTKYRT